jgi:hypothetical protein
VIRSADEGERAAAQNSPFRLTAAQVVKTLKGG